MENEKTQLGFLTEKSIQEIQDSLSAEKQLRPLEKYARTVAVELIKEFRERIKDGFELSDVIASVRHEIYSMGILEPLQLDQDAENEAKEVQSDKYQKYLQRKTSKCLRALGQFEEGKRNQILGLIRARFLKLDTEKAAREYFDQETGELKICIDGDTPIDVLLTIVALAEEAENSQETSTDTTVKKFEIKKPESLYLAKSSAQEHLIRRLISSNEKTIKKGNELFNLKFIQAVIDQMPDSLSKGRIGEKGAGVLMAYAGMEKNTPEFDAEFAKDHNLSLESLKKKLSETVAFEENQSYFLGSGTFQSFLKENDIGEASIIKDKYKCNQKLSEEDFEKLRQKILGGHFPRHVERQLKILFMEHLYGKPIICRSSSKLEDLLGASFAGKYKSIELANSSGDPEQDFERFLTAIKEVYASTFNPDAMEYRKVQNLLYKDEEMGILVQLLNGQQHGKFFYPDLSAVTYSRATVSTGSNPKEGLLRIGVGLGEGVVEKDEGIVTSLRSPKIRGVKPKQQELLTVLDMGTQTKKQMSWKEVLAQQGLSPAVISNTIRRYDHDNDYWMDCSTNDPMAKSGKMHLRGVIEDTQVPLMLDYITQKLKYIFEHDVDCEFTIEYGTDKQEKFKWIIKLVQCRPMNLPENLRPSKAPESVPAENILMHATECINGTFAKNLTHIFYIDPKIYKDGTYPTLVGQAATYLEQITLVVLIYILQRSAYYNHV